MPSQKDTVLGRLAVERGYVTQPQLDEALALQHKMHDEFGMDQSLEQILVSKHLLTTDQAQELRHAVAIQTGEARLVAGYEVISKLGQGGMGAVYKAKHPTSGQFVALKILPPSLATDELVKRFRREAEVVRKLDHANIVACTEFGFDKRRKVHFCALELVEGEDLAKRITRVGRLTEDEALSITSQIAMALQHAFFNGLVHRDVKPENVMVTAGGTAKLLDLGLARPANQEATRLTESGMFVGSPYYASPEQALGQREVDTRSDIYSLGATLYHMVTGKPPFEGTTALAILQKHVNEKLPWPGDVNPDLSDGLCMIIAKMMEKSPEDRYQTPNDLNRDLDLLMEGGEPEITDDAIKNSSVKVRALPRRPRAVRAKRGKHRVDRPPPKKRAVARSRESERAERPGRRVPPAYGGRGTSPGAIAGIVAGVAALIVIVLVVSLGSSDKSETPPRPKKSGSSSRGPETEVALRPDAAASAKGADKTRPETTTGYVPGLSAEYFAGTEHDPAKLKGTRIDDSIDFDWGEGEPVTGTGDTFSSRWTGEIHVPKAGKHTFKLECDDVGRLWINGKRVDKRAKLAAGWQEFKAEHVDNFRNARAILKWSGPGIDESVIGPEFFRTPGQDGLPDPKPTKRLPNVPADAVEFGGHWYKLYKQEMTWHEAKRFCEEKGGHLVTITSKEEQSLVASLARRGGGRGTWIGLTDEREEGKWEWVTGEKVVSTAWGSKEGPQGERRGGKGGRNENWAVLMLSKDYTWADIGKARCPHICEWEPGWKPRSASSAVKAPASTKPDLNEPNKLRVGLVGHWTFDDGEGTTARDSSGKGNHGKIVGGAKWTKGKIGGALEFDGRDDCVKVPHSSGHEPEHLTVEAWVHVAGPTSGRDARRWIVSKNRDGLAEGHYGLMIGGHNAGAQVNIGGGRKNLHWAWSAAGVLAFGRWQHLAMTYDGSVLGMYADGHLVASETISKKRVPGTKALCIGRRPDGFAYFRGFIDDVRIYDRALSAEEIRLLAHPEEWVKAESEPPSATEPPAPTLTLDLGGGVTMEMVYIKPGVFLMGGTQDVKPNHPWWGIQKPKHEVAITQGFYMGKYEVTQAQYEAVMAKNPSNSKGASKPVEQVAWHEAVKFCRLATKRTRKQFRLPTEAEWEYACRAGLTGKYCFGNDETGLGEYAWYSSNSGGQTHPVGQKKPNAWGLYDMHGNVWEWVADWYAADYYANSPRENPTGPDRGRRRLVRGGPWLDGADHCRSAFRHQSLPSTRTKVHGFRAVVLASPGVSASARVAYAKAMARAKMRIRLNNWKGAIDALKEALAAKPDDAEAKKLLAEAESHIGPADAAEAEAAYDDLCARIKKNPKDFDGNITAAERALARAKETKYEKRVRRILDDQKADRIHTIAKRAYEDARNKVKTSTDRDENIATLMELKDKAAGSKYEAAIEKLLAKQRKYKDAGK